jgi:hypothetical protein
MLEMLLFNLPHGALNVLPCLQVTCIPLNAYALSCRR